MDFILVSFCHIFHAPSKDGSFICLKKIQIFQNLGHMIDDVITGHMTDPRKKIFCENLPR